MFWLKMKPVAGKVKGVTQIGTLRFQKKDLQPRRTDRGVSQSIRVLEEDIESEDIIEI